MGLRPIPRPAEGFARRRAAVGTSAPSLGSSIRPPSIPPLTAGVAASYTGRRMAEDVFGIVGSIQAGIFRVEQVVAEGGFAVVYRAYHEGFRAKVALKCLKVPDAMNDGQRVTFLER